MLHAACNGMLFLWKSDQQHSMVFGMAQNHAPYDGGTHLGGHPDLCDIFNWDDDKRCPNDFPCQCKQEVVAAGATRGGNSCDDDESKRTDVDAVTFADRDWYYIPVHGLSYHKVIKGTWLKINSANTLRCDARPDPWPWSDKVPVCDLLFRL